MVWNHTRAEKLAAETPERKANEEEKLEVPRLKGISFENAIIKLNEKDDVSIALWRKRPLQSELLE